MVSSARQAIACTLVILVAAICSQAQTTGSISGKITIKGKPAAGVMVVASDPRDGGGPIRGRFRAKTDQTGSYRISNLPAGSYEISPITPALIPSNPSNSITLADGENVEDVDLSLVPGGVITGKITNSDGEPIIGEIVNIEPVSERFSVRLNNTLLTRVYASPRSTDDRGIYRIFGLPPGKYKVSVGGSGGVGNSREHYRHTFYPSVTDAEKATVIEVTEGSETGNVDIVVGKPVGTFMVVGRVVDGETGKPIPNVKYGVGQTTKLEYGSSSESSISGAVTNANGEFRLENLMPGTYTIFTAPPEQSDMPGAFVKFDVVDRDLTDLLIKTTKGSSLSGVLVLDTIDKVALDKLRICAAIQNTDTTFINSPSSTVAQDGSFKIAGIRSGLARFWLCSDSYDRKWFEIVRVERNGVSQPEAFNLGEGEQLGGFRVTVKYRKFTGAIRGEVKVENGELPQSSQMSLSIFPVDAYLSGSRTYSRHSPEPQLDARGRFFAEGLAAGTYRVSVSVFQPGQRRTSDITEQQVIVADDTVTEVTLVIKPQRKPD